MTLHFLVFVFYPSLFCFLWKKAKEGRKEEARKRKNKKNKMK